MSLSVIWTCSEKSWSSSLMSSWTERCVRVVCMYVCVHVHVCVHFVHQYSIITGSFSCPEIEVSECHTQNKFIAGNCCRQQICLVCVKYM